MGNAWVADGITPLLLARHTVMNYNQKSTKSYAVVKASMSTPHAGITPLLELLWQAMGSMFYAHLAKDILQNLIEEL